jgi:hypothetical protein
VHQRDRPAAAVRVVYASSKLASRAAYAYAAVAHDVSRLIFTAGACPSDEDGVIVAILGYQHQLIEVEVVAALR